MKYSENFVKWLINLLLGIGCHVVAYVIFFIACAFHEIAVEEDIMFYVMMGGYVLFLVMGWICLSISFIAKANWKLESEDKSKE